MKLLTVQSWFGPGRKMTPERARLTEPEIRTEGMVTRLPLGRAIERLNAYECLFNDRYSMATNFTVLSVQEIDDLTDRQIDMARLKDIDKLEQPE